MAKTLISTRLSEDSLGRLDEAAKKRGISRSIVIEEAVGLFLAVSSGEAEIFYDFEKLERRIRAAATTSTLHKPQRV